MRNILRAEQRGGGVSFPVEVNVPEIRVPDVRVDVPAPQVTVNMDLARLEAKIDMLIEEMRKPRVRTISGDPKKLETIVIRETVDGSV